RPAAASRSTRPSRRTSRSRSSGSVWGTGSDPEFTLEERCHERRCGRGDGRRRSRVEAGARRERLGDAADEHPFGAVFERADQTVALDEPCRKGGEEALACVLAEETATVVLDVLRTRGRCMREQSLRVFGRDALGGKRVRGACAVLGIQELTHD